MPPIDDLRAAGEKNMQGILAKLDKRHRARVQAQIERYGRVQDIPEEFWTELQREIEDEQVAAVMLLILAADEWTTEEVRQQGVTKRRRASQTDAALSAAQQVQRTAAQTVDTLRNRLGRRIEDAKASGPGDVGELTDEGIDQALDDVFTQDRRATIAADQTTTAFSTGQRDAAERIGRGGITNEAGQSVTLELIWRTERDNRVCPRCSPLEGQPESVWSQVFPEGPGPSAHPNCRCFLQPQIIVEGSAVRESKDKGRWVTIKGNPVKIADDGEVLTGPMKGSHLGRAKSDKSNPLDEKERNAIEDYTTDKFQAINKALRSDAPLAGENKKIVSRIDSALAKANKYKGPAVFRKFDADESLIAQLQVGKTFSDKAFISTSKDPPAFIPRGTVGLQIVGKSGVDISALSLHGSAEKEVLFPRNTKFKVVKAQQGKYGGWIAILQEI